jgi:hypothetical protein
LNILGYQSSVKNVIHLDMLLIPVLRLRKQSGFPKERLLLKQLLIRQFRKPKLSRNDNPSTSGADQWTVVSRLKRTPKTRNTSVDNSKHWTNSFQLLARVEGRTYDNNEIGKSNEAFKILLDEEMDNAPSNFVDKGKTKMEEEEERLMRGFSPHS